MDVFKLKIVVFNSTVLLTKCRRKAEPWIEVTEALCG